MKRSGKFYFKNEKEVLTRLGLTPVPGSGSGWIAKEDGENEVALVQLKSTDANSYTLKQFDMKQLEYHAQVAHKVPIFLVQFLAQDKIYAIVNVEDILEVSEALTTGVVKERLVIENEEVSEIPLREKVGTAKKSREQFHKENENKYGRRKSKRY